MFGAVDPSRGFEVSGVLGYNRPGQDMVVRQPDSFLSRQPANHPQGHLLCANHGRQPGSHPHARQYDIIPRRHLADTRNVFPRLRWKHLYVNSMYQLHMRHTLTSYTSIQSTPVSSASLSGQSTNSPQSLPPCANPPASSSTTRAAATLCSFRAPQPGSSPRF